MFRSTLIFSTIALLLAGCSEKTAAEKQEEERIKLREAKRLDAIKTYKRLATDFPDSEFAKQAADKAKALEAQAPKK